MFGISEIAIILIVVIVLLGAKRLPELARSAGKSARILKAEAKAMKEPEDTEGETGAPRVIRGETVPRHEAGDPGPTAGPRP
ncbi:twin-arginine translocase TatA/TatE family subunit [Streptomyces sp. JV185]|uniref:twin-arginine translocase TatA/TatE family subunit n=1 Tax=Streptomyces sp. JV185 TaxID=858638 RepID=UPI002E791A8A|nr:twin-arginine translocase TatA/TatE family subunit [Streptomyces sp. JV185]MEE1767793.1 twin-arginine translocase TatA/TatE family subunit [Streptomyces sp. JV185]